MLARESNPVRKINCSSASKARGHFEIALTGKCCQDHPAKESVRFLLLEMLTGKGCTNYSFLAPSEKGTPRTGNKEETVCAWTSPPSKYIDGNSRCAGGGRPVIPSKKLESTAR